MPRPISLASRQAILGSQLSSLISNTKDTLEAEQLFTNTSTTMGSLSGILWILWAELPQYTLVSVSR